MCWTALDWPTGFGLRAINPETNRIPTDLLRAARAVADQTAYREMTYRDLAKRLGHGCLTGDHEVLTPEGWVPISTKPPVIMTDEGFASVSNWIDKPYTGDFVSMKGLTVDLLMTADHSVIFTKDKRHQKMAAMDFAKQAKPTWKIPLGVQHFLGGDTKISPEEARLVAAYHSDGSIEHNRTRFHFHKQRKVDRLLHLCEAAGVTCHTQANEKYSIAWTFPFKYPGAYQLDWPRDAIEAYIDEYKYWDGHIAKTSVSLFSANRMALDWIQTLGRLVGVGGNFQKDSISGFGSTIHKLQQNSRKYAIAGSLKTSLTYVHAQVYCPTVPCGSFLTRRNGKICLTGNSNYYGKPPQMAKHTHVEKEIIVHFQREYFSAFPFIPQWHRKTAERVQIDRYITTLLGRRRYFFGRPDDDATLREAIAFEPQSVATGDYMNLGFLSVWQENWPVWLFSQVHDALAGAYDEQDEHWIIPAICKKLETEITLYSPDGTPRPFSIPTEPMVGWNLSYRNKDNPDGLIKWKGTDDRQRQFGPARSISDIKISEL